MNKETIPIFFTIDESYVPYFSVAAESLIENANHNYHYNIHIIHENLSKKSQEKIKTLETSYAKIIFNKITESINKITNRSENYLKADYFTLTIFYRLFLPEMFLEYNKAIYIDSDVCIPGDISQLYNIDLEDNLYGGCKDISCMDNAILCDYFKNNAGVTIDNYINSGVLLMNMQKLREVKFLDHFLYLLNKYHFDTVCPDQDYINAMAYGKIKLLPNEWNAMPTNGTFIVDNPQIVHYNLFFKPWHFSNIDYEDYFWSYANKSLFKDEILKEKENYSKENQQKDIDALDKLVQRTKDIVNQEVTFKNIFSNNKESRL